MIDRTLLSPLRFPWVMLVSDRCTCHISERCRYNGKSFLIGTALPLKKWHVFLIFSQATDLGHSVAFKMTSPINIHSKHIMPSPGSASTTSTCLIVIRECSFIIGGVECVESRGGLRKFPGVRGVMKINWGKLGGLQNNNVTPALQFGLYYTKIMGGGRGLQNFWTLCGGLWIIFTYSQGSPKPFRILRNFDPFPVRR